MKKVLLGLIVGFVIAVPAGAFARNYSQVASPFKVAECSDEDGADPSPCNINIDKFTDHNNVCYLVVGGTGDNIPSISCVKGN